MSRPGGTPNPGSSGLSFPSGFANPGGGYAGQQHSQQSQLVQRQAQQQQQVQQQQQQAQQGGGFGGRPSQSPGLPQGDSLGSTGNFAQGGRLSAAPSANGSQHGQNAYAQSQSPSYAQLQQQQLLLQQQQGLQGGFGSDQQRRFQQQQVRGRDICILTFFICASGDGRMFKFHVLTWELFT